MIGAEVGAASLVTPYGFNLKWLVLPMLLRLKGVKLAKVAGAPHTGSDGREQGWHCTDPGSILHRDSGKLAWCTPVAPT